MPWWPLFLAHKASTSKLINAPVDDVIRLLHDSVTLIRLNPLVTHVEVDPSNSSLYHIKDDLPFMGGKFETEYTVQFTYLDDGVGSVARAGLGTVLKGTMRARAVDGGTELSEDVTIEALFLVMPFIIKSFEKSHQEMLSRIAQRAQENVSRSAATGEET